MCHATLHFSVGSSVHPAVCQSACRSVHQSVRWSVGPSHFTFFLFLRSLASLLLPKWSSDLRHSPCPPARDWDSRVTAKQTKTIHCWGWTQRDIWNLETAVNVLRVHHLRKRAVTGYVLGAWLHSRVLKWQSRSKKWCLFIYSSLRT